jgi:hypothetical protein
LLFEINWVAVLALQCKIGVTTFAIFKKYPEDSVNPNTQKLFYLLVAHPDSLPVIAKR